VEAVVSRVDVCGAWCNTSKAPELLARPEGHDIWAEMEYILVYNYKTYASLCSGKI
jgi:hypothetical protein